MPDDSGAQSKAARRRLRLKRSYLRITDPPEGARPRHHSFAQPWERSLSLSSRHCGIEPGRTGEIGQPGGPRPHAEAWDWDCKGVLGAAFGVSGGAVSTPAYQQAFALALHLSQTVAMLIHQLDRMKRYDCHSYHQNHDPVLGPQSFGVHVRAPPGVGEPFVSEASSWHSWPTWADVVVGMREFGGAEQSSKRAPVPSPSPASSVSQDSGPGPQPFAHVLQSSVDPPIHDGFGDSTRPFVTAGVAADTVQTPPSLEPGLLRRRYKAALDGSLGAFACVSVFKWKCSEC